MLVDGFKFERTNPVAYGDAHFGQGTGPIYFDELACAGSEPDLFRCQRPPIGVHNCHHGEDAGVQCGEKFSKYLQIYGVIFI